MNKRSMATSGGWAARFLCRMEFGLSYDARSITVLEGLEAVRKRPGMYIGSTGERGLHHLVYEVVDNSVDEALAGHADNIEVTLLADGGVRVVDNGRGIPVDEHPVEHRPAVEVVMTTLHAGGKFDGKSYAVSGGLHGVGVSVVNALSWMLEVEVRRDGYVWTQGYERGDPMGPLVRGAATEDTGTTITFWPDTEIFETTDWSFETLSRRMQEMAFLNKNLAISITDERDQDEPRGAAYQYAGGIADFVRYINASKEPVHATVIDFEEEARRDLGRDRDAVDRGVHRVGAHVREHHQHGRGRHSRGGVPRRADLDRQPVRARPEAAAREGRQPDRGRRARGPDRDRLGQARRAAVRGPDQDQAGQHRGQVVRAEGRATTTCGTGSTATPARPRTSSTRPARRPGPGSPRARRAT